MGTLIVVVCLIAGASYAVWEIQETYRMRRNCVDVQLMRCARAAQREAKTDKVGV